MQGEGEELEPSAVVLRVVPDRAHFLPLGKGTPAVLAVQPSGTEKADAKATGKPVRISVFDQARTSAAQAIALREAFKEGPRRASRILS